MLKKLLAQLSIALFATALISACGREPTSGLKTYRFDDVTGHFSLDCPEEWYIGDKDIMASNSLFYINVSPYAKNSLNGLLVTFQDTVKISQDDFVSSFRKDFEYRSNPCITSQPTGTNGAVLQLTCDGYIAVFFSGKEQRYGLSYPLSNPSPTDVQKFEKVVESFRPQ